MIKRFEQYIKESTQYTEIPVEGKFQDLTTNHTADSLIAINDNTNIKEFTFIGKDQQAIDVIYNKEFTKFLELIIPADKPNINKAVTTIKGIIDTSTGEVIRKATVVLS